jgi:hypothetical protein
MNSDDFTPTTPGFHEPSPPALPRTITPSGARRVPPSETVPRLSAKKEAKLAVVDAESAAGYDAIEAAGDKLAQLTKLIEDGRVVAELEIDDSHVIKVATRKDPP